MSNALEKNPIRSILENKTTPYASLNRPFSTSISESSRERASIPQKNYRELLDKETIFKKGEEVFNGKAADIHKGSFSDENVEVKIGGDFYKISEIRDPLKFKNIFKEKQKLVQNDQYLNMQQKVDYEPVSDFYKSQVENAKSFLNDEITTELNKNLTKEDSLSGILKGYSDELDYVLDKKTNKPSAGKWIPQLTLGGVDELNNFVSYNLQGTDEQGFNNIKDYSLDIKILDSNILNGKEGEGEEGSFLGALKPNGFVDDRILRDDNGNIRTDIKERVSLMPNDNYSSDKQIANLLFGTDDFQVGGFRDFYETSKDSFLNDVSRTKTSDNKEKASRFGADVFGNTLELFSRGFQSAESSFVNLVGQASKLNEALGNTIQEKLGVPTSNLGIISDKAVELNQVTAMEDSGRFATPFVLAYERVTGDKEAREKFYNKFGLNDEAVKVRITGNQNWEESFIRDKVRKELNPNDKLVTDTSKIAFNLGLLYSMGVFKGGAGALKGGVSMVGKNASLGGRILKNPTTIRQLVSIGINSGKSTITKGRLALTSAGKNPIGWIKNSAGAIASGAKKTTTEIGKAIPTIIIGGKAMGEVDSGYYEIFNNLAERENYPLISDTAKGALDVREQALETSSNLMRVVATEAIMKPFGQADNWVSKGAYAMASTFDPESQRLRLENPDREVNGIKYNGFIKKTQLPDGSVVLDDKDSRGVLVDGLFQTVAPMVASAVISQTVARSISASVRKGNEFIPKSFNLKEGGIDNIANYAGGLAGLEIYNALAYQQVSGREDMNQIEKLKYVATYAAYEKIGSVVEDGFGKAQMRYNLNEIAKDETVNQIMRKGITQALSRSGEDGVDLAMDTLLRGSGKLNDTNTLKRVSDLLSNPNARNAMSWYLGGSFLGEGTAESLQNILETRMYDGGIAGENPDVNMRLAEAATVGVISGGLMGVFLKGGGRAVSYLTEDARNIKSDLKDIFRPTVKEQRINKKRIDTFQEVVDDEVNTIFGTNYKILSAVPVASGITRGDIKYGNSKQAQNITSILNIENENDFLNVETMSQISNNFEAKQSISNTGTYLIPVDDTLFAVDLVRGEQATFVIRDKKGRSIDDLSKIDLDSNDIEIGVMTPYQHFVKMSFNDIIETNDTDDKLKFNNFRHNNGDNYEINEANSEGFYSGNIIVKDGKYILDNATSLKELLTDINEFTTGKETSDNVVPNPSLELTVIRGNEDTDNNQNTGTVSQQVIDVVATKISDLDEDNKELQGVDDYTKTILPQIDTDNIPLLTNEEITGNEIVIDLMFKEEVVIEEPKNEEEAIQKILQLSRDAVIRSEDIYLIDRFNQVSDTIFDSIKETDLSKGINDTTLAINKIYNDKLVEDYINYFYESDKVFKKEIDTIYNQFKNLKILKNIYDTSTIQEDKRKDEEGISPKTSQAEPARGEVDTGKPKADEKTDTGNNEQRPRTEQEVDTGLQKDDKTEPTTANKDEGLKPAPIEDVPTEKEAPIKEAPIKEVPKKEEAPIKEKSITSKVEEGDIDIFKELIPILDSEKINTKIFNVNLFENTIFKNTLKNSSKLKKQIEKIGSLSEPELFLVRNILNSVTYGTDNNLDKDSIKTDTTGYIEDALDIIDLDISIEDFGFNDSINKRLNVINNFGLEATIARIDDIFNEIETGDGNVEDAAERFNNAKKIVKEIFEQKQIARNEILSILYITNKDFANFANKWLEKEKTVIGYIPNTLAIQYSDFINFVKNFEQEPLSVKKAKEKKKNFEKEQTDDILRDENDLLDKQILSFSLNSIQNSKTLRRNLILQNIIFNAKNVEKKYIDTSEIKKNKIKNLIPTSLETQGEYDFDDTYNRALENVETYNELILSFIDSDELSDFDITQKEYVKTIFDSFYIEEYQIKETLEDFKFTSPSREEISRLEEDIRRIVSENTEILQEYEKNSSFILNTNYLLDDGFRDYVDAIVVPSEVQKEGGKTYVKDKYPSFYDFVVSDRATVIGSQEVSVIRAREILDKSSLVSSILKDLSDNSNEGDEIFNILKNNIKSQNPTNKEIAENIVNLIEPNDSEIAFGDIASGIKAKYNNINLEEFAKIKKDLIKILEKNLEVDSSNLFASNSLIESIKRNINNSNNIQKEASAVVNTVTSSDSLFRKTFGFASMRQGRASIIALHSSLVNPTSIRKSVEGMITLGHEAGHVFASSLEDTQERQIFLNTVMKSFQNIDFDINAGTKESFDKALINAEELAVEYFSREYSLAKAVEAQEAVDRAKTLWEEFKEFLSNIIKSIKFFIDTGKFGKITFKERKNFLPVIQELKKIRDDFVKKSGLNTREVQPYVDRFIKWVDTPVKLPKVEKEIVEKVDWDTVRVRKSTAEAISKIPLDLQEVLTVKDNDYREYTISYQSKPVASFSFSNKGGKEIEVEYLNLDKDFERNELSATALKNVVNSLYENNEASRVTANILSQSSAKSLIGEMGNPIEIRDGKGNIKNIRDLDKEINKLPTNINKKEETNSVKLTWDVSKYSYDSSSADKDSNIPDINLRTNNAKDVYGFSYLDKNGKPQIVINEQLLDGNTPIHEYAHLYVNELQRYSTTERASELVWAKESKDIFQEMREVVIEEGDYLKRVKDNEEYSNLTEDEKIKEALVTAIGDKGEKILSSSLKSRFKRVLDKMFNFFSKVFGLEKDPKRISSMNLDELSNHLANDILTGKANLVASNIEAVISEIAKDYKPLVNLRVVDSLASEEVVNSLSLNQKNEFYKKKFGEKASREIRKRMPVAFDNQEELSEFLKIKIPVKEHTFTIIEGIGNSLEKSFLELSSKEGVADTIGIKSPVELLEKEGYTFNNLENYKEGEAFRGYYSGGDNVIGSSIICTYRDLESRFEENFMMFVVKDDAKETLRASQLTQSNLSKSWKDFLKENGRLKKDGSYNLDGLKNTREDPFSTSVLSIQINRRNSSLIIVSRYNHTIEEGNSNPDATFSNNLNSLVGGLEASLSEYLNIEFSQNNELELPGNVVQDAEQRFFKFSREVNGTYYGKGFYLKGGVASVLDSSKERMVNGSVLDLQGKFRSVIDTSDSIRARSLENQARMPFKEDEIKKVIFLKGENIKILTNSGEELLLVIEEGILKKVEGMSEERKINILLNSYGAEMNKENGEISLGDISSSISSSISFNIFGSIIENLEDRIVKIRGSVDFENSQITSMPNLRYIGENARVRRGSTITSLPKLEYIGGQAFFEDSQITSMPSLRYIGGAVFFEGSQIKSMPNLRYIGGEVFLRNAQITSMPNLRYIGGEVGFRNSLITSLPSLVYLGDSAYFQDSLITSMPNLRYIGGQAFFENSQITSMPNLEYIGEIANFQDSQVASMPNLRYIGGIVYFRNSLITSLPSLKYLGDGEFFQYSLITSLPNLEYIKHGADFRSSLITSIPNLRYIGDSASFQDSLITSMPKLEYIGGTAHLRNSLITSLPSLKSIGGFSELPDNNKGLGLKLEELQGKSINYIKEFQDKNSNYKQGFQDASRDYVEEFEAYQEGTNINYRALDKTIKEVDLNTNRNEEGKKAIEILRKFYGDKIEISVINNEDVIDTLSEIENNTDNIESQNVLNDNDKATLIKGIKPILDPLKVEAKNTVSFVNTIIENPNAIGAYKDNLIKLINNQSFTQAEKTLKHEAFHLAFSTLPERKQNFYTDEVINSIGIKNLKDLFSNYEGIVTKKDGMFLLSKSNIKSPFAKTYAANNIIDFAKNKINTEEDLKELVNQENKKIDIELSIELNVDLAYERQLKQLENRVKEGRNEQDKRALGYAKDNPDKAKKEIKNKIEEERKRVLTEWETYITKENEVYAKDPFIRSIIWQGITKNIKFNNEDNAPELNAGALASVMEDIESNPRQINFLKTYGKALVKAERENSKESFKISGKDIQDGEWIMIPSKVNDSENFDSNVKKLKALSNNNWCTANYMAKSYLSTGDFWLYLLPNSEKASVAIRFDGDEIAEIQGKRNKGKIPLEFLPEIKKLIEHKKWSGAEKQIEEAVSREQSALKFIEETKHLTDKEFLVKYFIEGSIVGDTIEGTLKAIEETDDVLLGERDFTEVLEGITKITKHVGFKDSIITSMPNLRYIGGQANLEKSQITSLPKLEYIGNGAYFRDSIITSMPNLRYIGGFARFEHSLITSMPNLRHIGGNVYFEGSIITTIPNLRHIGDSANFQYSQIKSTPKLEHIGGQANFLNSQITSLPNLRYIGGQANLEKSQITSMPNLRYIGADLYLRNSQITSMPNLRYIGSFANFENSQIKSMPSLEYIRQGANFENSQITSLPNLEHIGRTADFRNSIITTMPNLRHIGGFTYFENSQITSMPKLEHIGGFTDFGNSQITLPSLKYIAGSSELPDNNTELGLKLEEVRKKRDDYLQELQDRKFQNKSDDYLQEFQDASRDYKQEFESYQDEGRYKQAFYNDSNLELLAEEYLANQFENKKIPGKEANIIKKILGELRDIFLRLINRFDEIEGLFNKILEGRLEAQSTLKSPLNQAQRFKDITSTQPQENNNESSSREVKIKNKFQGSLKRLSQESQNVLVQRIIRVIDGDAIDYETKSKITNDKIEVLKNIIQNDEIGKGSLNKSVNGINPIRVVLRTTDRNSDESIRLNEDLIRNGAINLGQNQTIELTNVAGLTVRTKALHLNVSNKFALELIQNGVQSEGMPSPKKYKAIGVARMIIETLKSKIPVPDKNLELKDVDVIRTRFIGEVGIKNLDLDADFLRWYDFVNEEMNKLAQKDGYELPNYINLKNSLSAAKKEYSKKTDMEIIKSVTGWELGLEGMWKFEMTDNIDFKDEFIESEKGEGLLTEVFNIDPFLLVSYPSLSEIRVSFAPLENVNSIGYYNAEEKLIFLNTKAEEFNNKSNKKNEINLYSTILHEIQHAIQDIENFARGGSSSSIGMIKSEVLKETERGLESLKDDRDRYKEIYTDNYNLYKRIDPDFKELEDKYRNITITREEESRLLSLHNKFGLIKDRKIINSINKEIIEYQLKLDSWSKTGKDGDDDYLNYYRLAGEIEARDVEKTFENKMTVAELRDRVAFDKKNTGIKRENALILIENDFGIEGSYPRLSQAIPFIPTFLKSISKLSVKSNETIGLLINRVLDEQFDMPEASTNQIRNQVKKGNVTLDNILKVVIRNEVRSEPDILDFYMELARSGLVSYKLNDPKSTYIAQTGRVRIPVKVGKTTADIYLRPNKAEVLGIKYKNKNSYLAEQRTKEIQKPKAEDFLNSIYELNTLDPLKLENNLPELQSLLTDSLKRLEAKTIDVKQFDTDTPTFSDSELREVRFREGQSKSTSELDAGATPEEIEMLNDINNAVKESREETIEFAEVQEDVFESDIRAFADELAKDNQDEVNNIQMEKSMERFKKAYEVYKLPLEEAMVELKTFEKIMEIASKPLKGGKALLEAAFASSIDVLAGGDRYIPNKNFKFLNKEMETELNSFDASIGLFEKLERILFDIEKNDNNFERAGKKMSKLLKKKTQREADEIAWFMRLDEKTGGIDILQTQDVITRRLTEGEAIAIREEKNRKDIDSDYLSITERNDTKDLYTIILKRFPKKYNEVKNKYDSGGYSQESINLAKDLKRFDNLISDFALESKLITVQQRAGQIDYRPMPYSAIATPDVKGLSETDRAIEDIVGNRTLTTEEYFGENKDIKIIKIKNVYEKYKKHLDILRQKYKNSNYIRSLIGANIVMTKKDMDNVEIKYKQLASEIYYKNIVNKAQEILNSDEATIDEKNATKLELLELFKEAKEDSDLDLENKNYILEEKTVQRNELEFVIKNFNSIIQLSSGLTVYLPQDIHTVLFLGGITDAPPLGENLIKKIGGLASSKVGLKNKESSLRKSLRDMPIAANLNAMLSITTNSVFASVRVGVKAVAEEIFTTINTLPPRIMAGVISDIIRSPKIASGEGVSYTMSSLKSIHTHFTSSSLAANEAIRKTYGFGAELGQMGLFETNPILSGGDGLSSQFNNKVLTKGVEGMQIWQQSLFYLITSATQQISTLRYGPQLAAILWNKYRVLPKDATNKQMAEGLANLKNNAANPSEATTPLVWKSMKRMLAGMPLISTTAGLLTGAGIASNTILLPLTWMVASINRTGKKFTQMEESLKIIEKIHKENPSLSFLEISSSNKKYSVDYDNALKDWLAGFLAILWNLLMITAGAEALTRLLTGSSLSELPKGEATTGSDRSVWFKDPVAISYDKETGNMILLNYPEIAGIDANFYFYLKDLISDPVAFIAGKEEIDRYLTPEQKAGAFLSRPLNAVDSYIAAIGQATGVEDSKFVTESGGATGFAGGFSMLMPYTQGLLGNPFGLVKEQTSKSLDEKGNIKESPTSLSQKESIFRNLLGGQVLNIPNYKNNLEKTLTNAGKYINQSEKDFKAGNINEKQHKNQIANKLKQVENIKLSDLQKDSKINKDSFEIDDLKQMTPSTVGGGFIPSSSAYRPSSGSSSSKISKSINSRIAGLRKKQSSRRKSKTNTLTKNKKKSTKRLSEVRARLKKIKARSKRT